ncbi:hypothetical protein OESDEN_02524 [Oesophagostomum dentatum]|uniref:Uncharacterized protein n=1 Tax=Oesophagostomum dentatum TaxID=61180 RepID=A0A0B1TJR3_OESDE|nr:hypothetical protein OESDEN_02524 [Oesophagostomum dentatum]
MSMLGSFGLSQSEAVIGMTLMNAAAAPLCFTAPWLIERFGRRKMFIVITSLCALEWVTLGMAQIFVDIQAQVTSSIVGSGYGLTTEATYHHTQTGFFGNVMIFQNMTTSWLCGILGATIGQCALNLGLLIMSPMMISEICPYNTRPAIAQVSFVRASDAASLSTRPPSLPVRASEARQSPPNAADQIILYCIYYMTPAMLNHIEKPGVITKVQYARRRDSD